MEKNKINFSAIDFECATGKRFSACSVAIVQVRNAEIVEQWSSLIQPPNNYYSQMCIDVHGMTPQDTVFAKPFNIVYPEIKKRIDNRAVVAHNAQYDRSVFNTCYEYYNINDDIKLTDKWYCTYRSYRFFVKEKNTKLNELCKKYNIDLDHHNALSDAVGCAKLFIHYLINHIK